MASFFTLEAMNAKYGDSLLLHFGEGSASLILIDGGPAGVYSKTLKPRLKALKAKRSPGDALPVELMMVSHIDDDHIRGILDLSNELANLDPTAKPLIKIRQFWYNSFDDIIGNNDPALAGVLASLLQQSSKAAPAGLEHDYLVFANVAQGRELRDAARKLHWQVNQQFGGKLLSAPAPAQRFGKLSVTPLTPDKQRLTDLQKEWDKKLKAIKAGAAPASLAAIVPDSSPYNLSSIACLAEYAGKRMLLTGDALGSDVVAGLKAAGFLQNGAIHLDVLKMPHHGSNRNVDMDFLLKITADNYVISANGKYDNPDLSTLQLLSQARGTSRFTIHLTNHDGENDLKAKLDTFLAAEQKAGKKYKVVFRDDAAPSMKIDLLDAVAD